MKFDCIVISMDKIRIDVLWSILGICVISTWIGLIITTAFSERHEEPRLLTSKYPAVPNACSQALPFLYYLNFTLCKSLVQIARNECPSPKVCLARCPFFSHKLDLNDKQNVESLRARWNIYRARTFCFSASDSTLESPESFDKYLEKVNRGDCPKTIILCQPFFNKICLPDQQDEPSIKHLFPNADSHKRTGRARSLSSYMKRRSHEMFYIWVGTGATFAFLFTSLYLIVFLYFVRFTVYASLSFFFIFLLVCLGYSAAMIFLGGAQPGYDSQESDLTLGVHRGYWVFIAALIILFLYIYCDFLYKCYYSVPKAIKFLIYANRGIGGIASTLMVTLICMTMQILLVSAFVYSVYLVYETDPKIKLVMNVTPDCICINGYVESSLCRKTDFDRWCRDRHDGSECKAGGCYTYKVDLSTKNVIFITFTGLTTYYLLWFIKGMLEMVLGSTFVGWYRENFSTDIMLKEFVVRAGYCLKYQSGTLCVGALVMFCFGIFHILLQFVEHLVLYSFDLKRSRKQNVFVTVMYKLSKVTSPLIYIEAAVFNISYSRASKKLDSTMASKIKSIRFINKLVDMVLFICALVVVMSVVVGLTVVYFYPHSFIGTTQSSEIFSLMSSPFLIFLSIVVCSYFVVSNVLSMYSISVNAIFLCYISDIPTDVSRKRKYSSSKIISEAVNPDKFDVLGKLNDLEDSTSLTQGKKQSN